ncbi:MAG: hypothetical protein ACRDRH_25060 [Pseudonocardia sp.]
MYDQIELYGRIFDRQGEAAAAVTGLRERVTMAQVTVAQGAAPRTAAAVFVPLGGSQLYAYGTRSMVDAQMEAVATLRRERPDASATLDQVGREIEVRRAHGADYGYTGYVLRPR